MPHQDITSADKMDSSHESLSRAKDRAQLTATGAMSIVNVALLKQILDQGPGSNPYYMVSLVLIGSSITLQALAGVLSIVMTSLTGYYAKHQDDVCEDMCENMCGCRCVCPTRRRRTFPRPHSATHQGQPLFLHQPGDGDAEEHEALELRETRMDGSDFPEVSRVPEMRTSNSRRDVRSSVADGVGCCPCFITSNTLEEFEYNILDMYHSWEEHVVCLELKAAESKIMQKYWMQQNSKIKEEIEQTRARISAEHPSDNQGNPENNTEGNTANSENERHLRQLIDQLKECEKSIIKHERITREWEISRDKGQYLTDRASAIRRNQILKRATFWQHFINFIFFIVFILNAFITGIGIVGNDDQKIIPEITPTGQS